MKKVAYVIILWLTALFIVAGCSRDAKEDSEKEVLVNLNINVALSDVAQGESRSVTDDAKAENDDEKMQTLRVIVVRENGIVEDNRFIRLNQATELYKDVSFKVVSKEQKQIYLFVNEETVIKIGHGSSNELLKLTNYLSEIKQGDEFPTTEISQLTVQLDANDEQLNGALPMSECHLVEVPEKDHECKLFVTRAAVKFSFRITNKGENTSQLTGLTINEVARKEYYLPHNAKYEDEVIEGKTYRAITEYEVPANPGYYTHEQKYNTSLPVNKEVSLAPIYLLEGKFEGKYSVSVTINGAKLEGELNNLPRNLPRNTHVVVNITLNDHHLESIIVDVEPYREAILEPDFGL